MSSNKKFQNVHGMNDVLPDEVIYWQKLESTAAKIFHDYGFLEIRTPIMEDTALFARGIGDTTQVVQKEMYTFLDRGNDSVTLRPEGTAGVVRSYVQHGEFSREEISKLYYKGAMFRYERPQKGRLRQFHQIGCEVFGSNSAIADAEVVILADRLTRSLGIQNYVLQVNSLGTNEERRPYLEKLITHLNQLAPQLCAECQGRLQKNPLRTFDCKSTSCQALLKDAPTILESLGDESKSHFELFLSELSRAGVAYQINPRIVRGLDYYERTAFEFVSSDLGAQSTFCGGGRYNKLVEELGGKPTPGVGFGLGCERVILLMQTLAAQTPKHEGVFLIVQNEAAYNEARRLVYVLRDAGVYADMAFEPRSLKSQMKKADKGLFKFAAVIGEEELKSKTVALKDLSTGIQNSVAVDQLLATVLS